MRISKASAIWTSLACLALALAVLLPAEAAAQSAERPIFSPGLNVEPPNAPAPPGIDTVGEILKGGPQEWTSPERLSSSLQILLLLTVLSLAPAVLLMTTSFVRII